MDIKKDMAEFGINAVGMLAGLSGSFVASVLDDKEFSFKNALFNVIIAVPLSAYGTMAVSEWMNWGDKPHYHGMIGLGLGICGKYVGKGILKIGKKFEKNPTQFIQNKGGVNDGSDNN